LQYPALIARHHTSGNPAPPAFRHDPGCAYRKPEKDRRTPVHRVAVANVDHLLVVGLYRLGPEVLAALKILHTVAGVRRP
jgi:hypothetical protein